MGLLAVVRSVQSVDRDPVRLSGRISRTSLKGDAKMRTKHLKAPNGNRLQKWFRRGRRWHNPMLVFNMLFGFKFSGFFTWWMWRSIYLLKLPRLAKKVRVMTDWTLDLLFGRDIEQMIKCAISQLPPGKSVAFARGGAGQLHSLSRKTSSRPTALSPRNPCQTRSMK